MRPRKRAARTLKRATSCAGPRPWCRSLVPLFISAFRRADELATAMECRCYHGGEGRTKLHVLRYHKRDLLCILLTSLITAGVVILSRLGF